MGMGGRVLADRYAVGQLLGRGGMAEVYLATDRVLDRPVTVKVLGSWLADDGTFVERFR
jgi:serine/threonine protein kinase